MKAALNKTWRRAPVVVALCLLGAVPVTADTQCTCDKFWIQTDPGTWSWHEPTHWDPVGVPGDSDTPCILEDGAYTVKISSPVTIADFKVDVANGLVNFKIWGTTMTVNGMGEVTGDTRLKVMNGGVLLGGATESVSASLAVDSVVLLDNGTLDIDTELSGDLTWDNTAAVTGTLTTLAGCTMAAGDSGPGAHLVVADGFDNHCTLLMDGVPEQSLEVTSGTFFNASDGVITTKGPNESIIASPGLRAELVNDGTVEVDGVNLVISRDGANHDNRAAGNIQVTNAELEIDLTSLVDVPSNFTNHGTVATGGGGSVRVRGAAGTVDVPSNFTNHGTVAVGGGGSVRVRGAGGDGSSLEFVNHGQITVDAVVDTSGLLELDAVDFKPEDGIVAGSGEMTITGSQIVGPAVYVNDLDLVFAESSVAADVEFTNQASMVVRGVSTFSGDLESTDASFLALEGSDDWGPATVLLESGLLADGVMVLGNSSTLSQDVHLSLSSGPLQIGANGALQITSGAGGDRRITGELQNNGEVVTVDSDLSIDGGGLSHANQGTINISGGNLEIFLDDVTEVPSNFTNHGTVAIGGGSSFFVRGGVGESRAGSFVNWGQLDIGLASTVSVEETEFENQATAQVTGSGQLDLTQATVLPFNGLLSPGSSPGVLTVDGALEEGPGATILIEIGGEIPGASLDRLDVTGALTIDGLLDVDLLATYHPVGGEQYQILTFGQSQGWFETVELPALQHMLIWDVVTSSQDVWLEVLCDGTQLGVVMTADNDPVSVGEDVTYHVIVTNHATVAATGIVVTDALPPELVFQQMLSSPECALIGNTVECNIAEMLPGSTWAFSIVAEAAVAGPIDNTVTVESWECDVEPTNNQSTVTINAVLAEPCDANYDLDIDPDDVEPAIHHIFGQTAPGNPDCRHGGGVGADDVAALIEKCQ